MPRTSKSLTLKNPTLERSPIMRTPRTQSVNSAILGFDEEDFTVFYSFDVDFEFVVNVVERGEVFEF